MLAAADTIKEMLKTKKVSQTELAEKLGTSKQNIGNKMKRNTFSPDELVKIADILDMKLAFIDGSKQYIISSDDGNKAEE